MMGSFSRLKNYSSVLNSSLLSMQPAAVKQQNIVTDGTAISCSNDSVSSGEVISRRAELCIVERSISAFLFDAGLLFLYQIEHGGNLLKEVAGKGGRRGPHLCLLPVDLTCISGKLLRRRLVFSRYASPSSTRHGYRRPHRIATQSLLFSQ